MSKDYVKEGKKYEKQWRFFFAYLRKSKDGRSFIRGIVEEDTQLKKGDVVLIFPAKTRAKESSPQYYGFHQAPPDPTERIHAPVDKPESDEDEDTTPKDPADQF